MSILISVVICTYNRADLLPFLLRSLERQTASQFSFEVIIVDNNSIDHTPDVIKDFVQRNFNFRMVKECKQGLSNARNRGYLEANGEYVVYIDDDSWASDNLVERILFIVGRYNFHCFGGLYLPWFKYRRPKWFLETYGSNGRKLYQVGVLENGFASGGVIVFRKAALQYFGGFSPAIGMRDKIISYGEETHLQVKMRKKGLSIGFDPELIVYHLVRREKFSIYWFFKSKYYHGKGSWLIFQKQPDVMKLFFFLAEGLTISVKALIFSSFKLFNQNYYLQNWLIDLFGPLSYSIGQLIGGISVLKNSRW